MEWKRSPNWVQYYSSVTLINNIFPLFYAIVVYHSTRWRVRFVCSCYKALCRYGNYSLPFIFCSNESSHQWVNEEIARYLHELWDRTPWRGSLEGNSCLSVLHVTNADFPLKNLCKHYSKMLARLWAVDENL